MATNPEDGQGHPPRIGVYVCHCGQNIAGVVDVEAVRDYAATLPQVVVARDNVFCCAEPGQLQIEEDIRSRGVNRVLIAACSPRLHEPTFRRVLEEAGLNPYLVEMANIREHCSWVHGGRPQAATGKAKELLAMGAAKAALLVPLADRRVPVVRKALVIGGGIAGLQAALDLADAGHRVLLVERSPFLGGRLREHWRTFPRGDLARCLITPLMSRALLHPGVEVVLGAEVVGVEGHIGSYRVRIHQRPRGVTDACDLCGRCAEVCPCHREDAGTRAIYIPDPGCAPPAYAIDFAACNHCGACVTACPQSAVHLEMPATEYEVAVGAVVVASGFRPHDPRQNGRYPFSTHPNAITSVELERRLDPQGPTRGRVLRPADGKEAKRIAFLQCVGSRQEDGNRYCSRVCCMVTLKQAQLLRQQYGVEVTIYYRDIRALKKSHEDLYARVRASGASFCRGQVQRVEAGPEGTLLVYASNDLLQRPTVQEVDLLVLAVGMEPNPGAEKLREILKIPQGDDGFFLEAHPKLHPLETVQDGIFLAGTCQGPKDISETVAHASGAAAKVDRLLAHDTIVLDGLVATVDPEECVGCHRCVQNCPFHAVAAVTGADGKMRAEVIAAACKGCGVCAGECPTGAAQVLGSTDEQLLAQVDAALQQDAERKVLVFACNWCAYAGADAAGVSRLQYPECGRIVRVPCSGRVSDRLIVHALRAGAGAVLVAGCHPPGDCHYIAGNLCAARRVERLRRKLPKRGLEPKRLHLEWISATEGPKLQKVMARLCAELAAGQSQAAG